MAHDQNSMRKNLMSMSKFVSMVLRHKPQEIGLKLDEHGWADVAELLEKMQPRHGKPVIYKVKSGEMSRDGYVFYLSVNNVWLTKKVPVKYLER